MSADAAKEIADLNLNYMLLAMSLADTIKIASSNFVLCAFRLDEAPIVKTVLQGERQTSLQQAHIAIVLAGARHKAGAVGA